MLLCAQYILPITSEPFQKGAVLVRDNVIRDIGTAEMLKLRYPDEEVVDFGRRLSCRASSTCTRTSRTP